MRDLYAELCQHYQVQPNRRGWCDVECPYCGAEANNKNKPNFSFSQYGFKCQSCQKGGNLKSLAVTAGLWTLEPGHRPESTFKPAPPRPAAPVQPEPDWKANPEQWLEQYVNHPQKFELWEAYKPVSRETILKHSFGVGALPEQSMTRLIVPLFWKGRIAGFKGRKLHTAAQEITPWIHARGTNGHILWGLDYVPKRAKMVWLCENYVDASLVTQVTGYPAISGGGARSLSLEELYALKSLEPQHVIVAYDNDLVGTASPAMRAELEREWIADWLERHPDKTQAPTPPKSVAFPLVNELRQAGLPASSFPWPERAPHKADVLWALSQTV